MDISGIILSGNMNEQVIYDDPGVQCAVYSVAYDSYFRSQVPWHWHDEIEILRVVRGSCMYRTAAGDTELPEGDAVFLPPGVLHCLVPLEAGTLTHALLFTREFLAGGAEGCLEERYVTPLLSRVGTACVRIGGEDPVLAKVEEAEKLGIEKPYFYEPALLSCLWEIWRVLLAKTAGRERPAVAAGEDARIKRMLLFIEEHYGEDIGIADIAGGGDVSERACYRLFAEELHESPAKFLSAYRIRCSEKYLLSGDLPVTAIAQRCGFVNSSHFSRVFRDMTGMTPREFRKQFTVHTGENS